MITYESLRDLALILSKITGYRYIAFQESNTTADLVIKFSNSQMRWCSSERHPHGGYWLGALDLKSLDLGDLPFLDWSKCQFDCEEK